jgi:hypothetical protein
MLGISAPGERALGELPASLPVTFQVPYGPMHIKIIDVPPPTTARKVETVAY